MRNQIANLYNTVSAPATGTQEALTERLQNECETGSLLYNRVTGIIRNGKERFKDIIEKSKRRRVTKVRAGIDGCFD